MKKLSYLIVIVLISSLVLTGCSLLSNVGQVPTNEQSGISYLTKGPNSILVARWKFDEESGATAVADNSENNNTGIIYEAIPGVVGQFGNALSFDGEDDYVEVDHNTNLNPSDITIEAWIYPTSWTHTDKAVALATKRTAHGNGYFLFYYRTTNTITFDWGGSTGANRWNTGYNPPLNTWTHLAVTRSLTGRALYVNGSLNSSTILAGDPVLVSTTSPLRVGYDSMAAQYPFQGTIDEVRIWNEALTASQLDDMLPPVVYSSNNGAIYLLNQKVNAIWEVSDGIGDGPGSGVTGLASNVGSVSMDSALDTSTAGSHSFTVTATDYAKNTATETVNYVVYGFGGILPPFKPDDGTSVFKLGRTIPVKFQLWDSTGDFVSSAMAEILWEKTGEETSGTEEGEFSTVIATTGDQFRYDDIDNQYIFNLSTKTLSTGTWKITIIVNGSGSYSEEIVLK